MPVERKSMAHRAVRIDMEDTLQQVFDIIEGDDGKSFEEKKKGAVVYIDSLIDELLSERISESAGSDEVGKRIKKKFWDAGVMHQCDEHILMHAACEKDKEGFLGLQKEVCIAKSMLKDKLYQDMLWDEHIQNKSMMFTVEVDGEYAGYCGINDLSRENWELAIELLRKFRYRGIGYCAISIMLTEIKTRIGVNRFRIKIDPDNYASQRLFEKLGAVPYGVAEFMLHNEEDIIRCEEENLENIDENLIEVARKFGVEPRKLLSHVLEYELIW